MGVWGSYLMRLRRKRLRLRALRALTRLRPVTDRRAAIRPGAVLLFSTQRNEIRRLPHFLDYYRNLGVDHFLFVDNDSDDGSVDLLSAQPDVTLWSTPDSYREARYGMDWMNGLLSRHGHGHWCLTVDPDELLQFPFCDTRPLRALTDWLQGRGIRSYPAMLLDLYPRARLDAVDDDRGRDPLDLTCWFDPGNYRMQRNPLYGNLWIQGGPRQRVFFPDAPEKAPALNKIPLVHWDRRYAYVSSTHMLLPRGLNRVHEERGGEKPSGILLHAKFLPGFGARAREELHRGEHYGRGREYRAYAAQGADTAELWCPGSERFINWRQLETLGLMSRADWA